MLSPLKCLIAAIGVLILLQGSIARPAPVVNNDGIIERRETYESPLLERELVDFANLDTRADIFDEGDSLEQRAQLGRSAMGAPTQQSHKSTQVRKETKANPYTPKNGKPNVGSPAPKEDARPGNHRKALPNSAKLTLSKDARKELDRMGLRGKARRNTIKWHKIQVKEHMKTNPTLEGKAKTGVIEHVAHEGGSNPKEENHITASFLRVKNNKKLNIPNTFNDGKNHHLYVNNKNKGLNRQARGASAKNNAQLKGQSPVGRTRTPGKSSNKGKGKGKLNPTNNFSKEQADKGFQK